MKMVRRIAAAVLLASFLSSLQAALCQQSAVPTQEDGIQALNARDFVRAEQIFSTLHKSAPSAENTGYLAMAEAGAGDLAGAISHFQESIRMGMMARLPTTIWELPISILTGMMRVFENCVRQTPRTQVSRRVSARWASRF